MNLEQIEQIEKDYYSLLQTILNQFHEHGGYRLAKKTSYSANHINIVKNRGNMTPESLFKIAKELFPE